MPRPGLRLLDNYAQTGNNACPQHAAASSCGLGGQCALRPSLWLNVLATVAVASKLNHVLTDRHAPHQDLEGKLGSVATPLTTEETVYNRNQPMRPCHSRN